MKYACSLFVLIFYFFTRDALAEDIIREKHYLFKDYFVGEDKLRVKRLSGAVDIDKGVLGVPYRFANVEGTLMFNFIKDRLYDVAFSSREDFLGYAITALRHNGFVPKFYDYEGERREWDESNYSKMTNLVDNGATVIFLNKNRQDYLNDKAQVGGDDERRMAYGANGNIHTIVFVNAKASLELEDKLIDDKI